MKTVLITGGAGFIGSHLCEALLSRGDAVFAVDNLFSGSRRNIERLFSNKQFAFINADITEPLAIGGPVDEIYNLACPASPVWYQRDPVKTVRTNVLGAVHMLELARGKGAKILQASTSEVYGDPLEHPQKESYRGNVSAVGPRACYDEGKRCAETLFFDYHRQFNLPVKVVRIFNAYGPRMAQNDGRVVSNFIAQALQGKPITIYGQGEQTRSFQYVSDLVAGLIAMMESKDFTGPVNIGNPSESTIRKLAERVLKLTGSKSELVYKPLPQDDPRRRRPDISLAKEKLGWSPKVPLEEGLKKTIEYFKQK